MQPLTKPVIDRRLAKMTERRITDVVHQAGHFTILSKDRSAYPDRTPPVGFALSGGLNLFRDITPLPAALHRMRQASTHRGIAPSGKPAFLLQRRIAGER